MPDITPHFARSFTVIHLAADNRRIGLWGRSQQGNLSLNLRAVERDAALKAAFDKLGPEVWRIPGSTPHDGNGYYKTKTGISWEEAVQFLAACGYTMVEPGGDAIPEPSRPQNPIPTT